MGWTRETSWVQGAFLSRQSLAVLYPNAAEDTIAVAVSHSCDIANEDSNSEPSVEFVLARRLQNCDGNFELAKNPRKLHLRVHRGEELHCFELEAKHKFCLLKEHLHRHEPDEDYELEPKQLQILQTWLAARYKRQALPDALQARLKPVFKQMERQGRKCSQGILGFWLDFEPREELAPEDRYEVWIYVVFLVEDGSYETAANLIAHSIEEAAKSEEGLDLRECAAFSEEEFTFKDFREKVQYRAEHISYRTDPPGPII